MVMGEVSFEFYKFVGQGFWGYIVDWDCPWIFLENVNIYWYGIYIVGRWGLGRILR